LITLITDCSNHHDCAIAVIAQGISGCCGNRLEEAKKSRNPRFFHTNLRWKIENYNQIDFVMKTQDP